MIWIRPRSQLQVLPEGYVELIQVSIDELKPGMVLARSIITANGDLLLAAGFEINEKVLVKLVKSGIAACWVYEEGTEHVIPEELVAEQVALQAKGAVRENLEVLKDIVKVQDRTLEGLAKFMSDPSKFRNILVPDRLKTSIKDIIDNLMGKEAAVVNLASIASRSGYMHQHAFDVAVASIVLANRLRYTRQEVEELAMGCLLMDFGMVVLPEELVNCNRRLSFQEFMLIKEHPTYGYTILRENDGIPITSAHVAYQHHERQDGGGYPRRLRGNNALPVKSIRSEKGWMHRYSEIAAVLDYYMGLIAPRPGAGSAKSPQEAVSLLIAAAGTHLNRAVVDTLVTLIPFFPVGSRVAVVEDESHRLLGYTGVVAKYNPTAPERPLIILLQDRDKRKVTPMRIDLAEEDGMKVQFMPLY